MCSAGGAYAGLMLAQGIYSYGKQAEQYREAEKLRQQNKESAEEELRLTYQQLNTREAQERAALVNQERLRGRRNLELGEQASEQKFFDQIAAEKALSAIKARGGGEVRGLAMDIERDLARSTFGTAENLRREREMLGFQRSIDKQNFKYLQQQIGISRRGAKATYLNRLRSFQMPGKPDPISALFGASSGVLQGASMDASSGNSWFGKKKPNKVDVPKGDTRFSLYGGKQGGPYGGYSGGYGR